ncbi:hypothetical protein [Vibrio hepatarius]|uniref:hypothetical protein n=1 Tax=Vibrio hepatarius TaxID=171383 RepID=UPI00148B42BF|nr:hypothetical protein [Vibrio hepatarius]NOI16409.1 hypothetical protein [Vibrio hepatarius]
MADNFLPEEAVWEEGVRQVETTDTVLGGPGGTPNIAPGQLANRTLYLKEQIEKSKDDLIGLILPDSTALVSRDNAFLADGSSYLVSDYPKLMSKVQGTAIIVNQSLINANPEQYAACYGISDDGSIFTVPNYSLRPHLAVAGSFGSVGSTIEDQIQEITGSIDQVPRHGIMSSAGAFDFTVTGSTADLTGATSSNANISFKASRVARTGDYTEVNSSFLNFYIIHGEVA